MSPEAGQSAQSRGSSFYLCHPDIQCLQFPAFAPWGVIGTCKTSIGLVGRHVYTSAGLLVAEPDSGLRVLNALSLHDTHYTLAQSRHGRLDNTKLEITVGDELANSQPSSRRASLATDKSHEPIHVLPGL
ncbi:hypothetical protein AB1N83_010446 [Pleurotus pulmonarius]